MFTSLLVPLDRTPNAEQALPWAMRIAGQNNARVRLVAVHVVYCLERPLSAWEPYKPEKDAGQFEREECYLAATAQMLRTASSANLETEVLNGCTVLTRTVADGLLKRVRATETDLIVIASRARSAALRGVLGSVADDLVRLSPTPVLIVASSQKPIDVLSEVALDTFLIPLDGSSQSEQALGVGVELAQQMTARCILLRVLEEGMLTGSAKWNEAADYLEDHAAKLVAQGVSVETQLVVGTPAEAIRNAASSQNVNLIVLATHGRGVSRMLFGSVADEVIRHASCPVLVCGPHLQPRRVAPTVRELAAKGA